MAFVKPADFLTMTTKIQNHCTAMQIKRSMSKVLLMIIKNHWSTTQLCHTWAWWGYSW